MKKKYLEEGLSPNQIAIQLGVSKNGVVGRLWRLGILAGQTSRPYYLTAQTPYGWKKEKGKLVLYFEEQRIIEEICKSQSEGQSLHLIARSLNLKRIKSKNGGQWNTRTVSRILKRAKKDQQ